METWDAKGKLRPLWTLVGGRDALAAKTGILATTLSSYNSGRRRLGLKHGQLIADALGVTIQDLGAPERDEAILRRAIRAELELMIRENHAFEELLRRALEPPREIRRPRPPASNIPFAVGD